MSKNSRRSEVLVADSAKDGPRVGWRIWTVMPDPDAPDRPILAGVGGQTWHTRQKEARCTNRTSGGWYHRWVPDVDCTCGVYGVEDLADTPAHSPRRPYAVGFVKLSGRILIEETTLRAARGEMIGPVRLVLPSAWRKQGRRVLTGDGVYRSVPGWLRLGSPTAEWEAGTVRMLRDRYGVDAVTLES